MLKILISLAGLVVAIMARNLDLAEVLVTSSCESSGEASCDISAETSGESSGDSSCYRDSPSSARNNARRKTADSKYEPQDYRDIPRPGEGL